MVSLNAYIMRKQIEGKGFRFYANKGGIGYSPELSPYLIENTLTITHEHEYTKPFEFIASSASFQLTSTAKSSGFISFSQFNNIDSFLFISISINGQQEFTGYVDIESFWQDRRTGYYNIELIDPIKLLYDNWEDAKFLGSEDTFTYVGEAESDATLICIAENLLGNQLIKVGNEQIYLGTNLGYGAIPIGGAVIAGGYLFGKCTRGYNGTSAAEHPQNTIGYLVSYSPDNNLEGFLKIYNRLGGVNVDVADLEQTFTLQDWKTLVNNILINDLMLEMQKNYNAVAYIGSDLKIAFRSKYSNSSSIIEIDNYVEEDNESEYAQTPALYNSILINAKTSEWEGYGFISSENRTEILGINEDLGNIPKGYNYLDLRTLLPRYNSSSNSYTVDYGFENVLFKSKTLTEALKVYWNLLIPLTPFQCNVRRLDLYPLQFVRYRTKKYQVQKITKYYDENYSELQLLEVNNG